MQSSAKVTQSKGSLSYRKGSHFFARVGIRAAGRPPKAGTRASPASAASPPGLRPVSPPPAPAPQKERAPAARSGLLLFGLYRAVGAAVIVQDALQLLPAGTAVLIVLLQLFPQRDLGVQRKEEMLPAPCPALLEVRL